MNRVNNGSLRTVCIFTTQAGMQMQVGQEMEFIIHFYIPYEIVAVGTVVFLFQSCHRILRRILVRRIPPVRIRKSEVDCAF